jgi:uncharacterized phage protein (TIGR01671 family)
MREIKFRAKVEGKVVYSDGFMKHPNGTIIVIIDIMDEGFKTCPIDKGTLKEFTGLKDKNGVDIYEGDIVQCKGHECTVKYRGNFCDFVMDMNKYGGRLLNITKSNITIHKIKVIGNINTNKL